MPTTTITREEIADLADLLDGHVAILDALPTVRADMSKAARTLRATVAHGFPVGPMTLPPP